MLNQESFLIFIIQGQHYALSLKFIQEITSLTHFHFLPKKIGNMIGIVHLHNQILSVIYPVSFKPVSLKEEQIEWKKERLVVLQLKDNHCALFVDKIVHIKHLFMNDMIKSNNLHEQLCIYGIIQTKETQYWILSVEKLFNLL